MERFFFDNSYQTLAAISAALALDSMHNKAPNMPKKPKPKKFNVVAAVKAAAREKVGPPPPTRKAPAKPKHMSPAEKHKPTLGRLLADD